METTQAGIKVTKESEVVEFDWDEYAFLFTALTTDQGHFDQEEYDRIRPRL